MTKQEKVAWERIQSEIKTAQERNIKNAAEAEARRLAEEKAAEEKAKEFIPNKWIVMQEKIELAIMIWTRSIPHSKIFIDPRHAEIYRVFCEVWPNTYLYDLDQIMAALDKYSSKEKYGGKKFITDVFSGLPD